MLIGLIPVFNEEESVTKILNKLEKQLDYIIIVNDGSFDQSDSLVSAWTGNRKNTHYISYEKNKGMSYALLQGFKFICDANRRGSFSRNDLVIMIDGDNQHDPDEIKNMYGYFNNNQLDVLIAERDFSGYPRYRIIGNRLMSSIASRLAGFSFKDIECGFKIMKVSFIANLLCYYNGFRYSCAGEIGLAARLLGYNIDNGYKINVSYYRRRGPNFIDLLINLMFYFLIFYKIKSTCKLRNPLTQDNPCLSHKMS